MISLFYNRGADHIEFDPPDQADREKSAHMVFLGTSGSGGKCADAYEILDAKTELVARNLVEPGAMGGVLR